MNKYEKYKDSGIAWIGEIPEHWNEKRLSDIGKYRKGPFGSALKVDSFVQKSIDTIRVYEQQNAIKKSATLGTSYISSKYFNESMSGFEVLTNDIIVSCAGTIGEMYLMPDNIEKGIINQALMRMRLNTTKVNLYFFLYLFDILLRIESNKSSNGSAMKNIPPFDILKKIRIPLPQIAEQEQIVNYLDWKCGEVDKVIATRGKQIELLKELRTSVISRAVTKGLDPTVAMKNSGIERIGETPEHWDICQYKIMAKICNGQDQKKVIDINGKYPIYGSGGVFGMANAYLYDKPSILLGRKGTIDRPLFVDNPFWSVDTMFYTKIKNCTYAKYLYYLSCLLPFNLFATGTVLPSVTQADLSSVKVICPPIIEQQVIADFLDRKTADIDNTIGKYKKQVDALKEYRQALITEVVTGKIDVRNVEIPQENSNI